MSLPAGLCFSHPACLGHEPERGLPGHPERPERLRVLEAALEQDWPAGWERRSCPAASDQELELIHDPGHVARMRALEERGGGAVDIDTYVGPGSIEAARRAAGGALQMTRDLLRGEAPVGFCATRPPGHHAEAGRAMGFCLFNSIAIAAQGAVREAGLSRVLILDWDVHHGNGTAEAFRERPDVLYASIHQAGIFPGTGALSDAGTGEGEGATINLPVPAGSGPALWLGLLTRVILPVARAFQPQLILISAGFDAHLRDPLASCSLDTASFAAMASLVRGLSRELEIPVGALLEGGYETAVLGECVLACMRALAGEGAGEASAGAPPAPSPAEEELIEGAAGQVRSHWPL